MIGTFFKSNDSLSKIQIENCEFGEEGARQLSLAIGNCGKSLKVLNMANDEENLENGQVVDIITALSMHPQLEELRLSDVNFGRNGCIALSTLLRCTTTQLRSLNLNENNIGDAGVEMLVNALTTVNTLQDLELGATRSITIRGWKEVASLLERPGSYLENLSIYGSNIGDKGALIFANALANNSTLKHLDLDDCRITREGWAHFSKLLCDTSSVNKTYSSNHTLQYVGDDRGDFDVRYLLVLNKREDKRQVAITKILHVHSHFDMKPFFEWELKVLPLMIQWFTKASTCTSECDEKINRMRLSATYDFIREFPMLYIEPITRKEIAEYTAMEEQLHGKPLWQEKLGEIRECKATSPQV